MVEQVIVSNGGEVGKLEIVDIGGIAFLYLLFDIGIYHCKRLSRTGRSQYDGGTERIHDIDPAIVPLLAIIEPCRQIYRIFVFDKPCFLHETFVLVVEHIVHKVLFEKAGDPYTCGKQAEIADGKSEYIKGGACH